MIWDELLKAAMLGTDQTDLSIELLAELETLGLDIKKPPEEILARGLAYYRALQKASAKLPRYEGDIPEKIEAEDTRVCSPKSSRHLRLILDGTFEGALPEFIALLNDRKRSLPPESLPALLDRCVKDRDLWQKIEPAVGKVGRWLIRQNPNWQLLSPRVDPEKWPGAGKEERRLILEQWRRTEPAAAVQALEKCWEELDHAEKAAFLKTLQTGLSLNDEPFLEKCLDDGRKPVRRQAAELMVQLPDSQLQQRLFTAAAEMISLEERRLRLRPPEQLSKELIRSGIEQKNSDYARSNQRLGWLLQIAERIPPRRWERHFDLAPEELLALAKEADKTKNFLRALARAALLHADQDWLGAIARFWSIEQEETMWTSTLGKQVLAGLSETAANTIVTRCLERNENLVDERSLAGQLLSLGLHSWEDRPALLLVKGFQNWLAGAQTMHWNLWHYKNLLTVAAYRCSPDLIPKFQTGWHTSSRIWGLWEADVERFMRILYFRKEMREEMQN
jgi:hypothetical protein